MANIKVIFLDVDGVLNSKWFFENRKTRIFDLDESRIPLLKKIVDETGAKLVLSSSWRRIADLPHYQQLTEMLAKYELSIHDFTGENNMGRGAEIQDWLAAHSEIDDFCIIDDEISDMGEDLSNHLVQTSFHNDRGIEEKHVKRAIEILNRKGILN